MKLAEALQGVTRLFLDTASVMYLVEKNPAYVNLVRAVFQRLDSGQLQSVTSPVTLAECLVHPLRQGLFQLRQDFINVVVNGVSTTFVGLDQTSGEIAGALRARYNLRLPDALQLAAALSAGCEAFLTNDAQLKRVTELQILVLDDLEI